MRFSFRPAIGSNYGRTENFLGREIGMKKREKVRGTLEEMVLGVNLKYVAILAAISDLLHVSFADFCRPPIRKEFSEATFAKE